MTVTTEGLREDIDKLLNTKLPATRWKLIGEFIVEGESYFVNDVLIFQSHEPYTAKYAPERFIKVHLPWRTYSRIILPNLDKLKFRLTYELQREFGIPLDGAPSIEYNFNAHIPDPISVDITAPSISDEDEALDDVSNMPTIRVQLTTQVMDEMRLVHNQGIPRNCTVSDVMKYYLGYELQERASTAGLDAPDYQRVRGVDMWPANNEKVYDHIPVPTGTLLRDVPKLLQESKGVYASGIGYYYKRGWWFVFPQLDTTRFDKVKKTLTIVNVPRNEIGGSERSYITEGDAVWMIATGDTLYRDATERDFYTFGNEFAYSPASKLFDGQELVKKTNNEALSQHNDFMKGFSVTERPGELYNTHYDPDTFFTDNPYPVASELSSGLGVIAEVAWDAAHPDLIYPGQPVKFVYVVNGEIRYRYGTLVGAIEATSPETGRALDNDYICRISLRVFMEREERTE